MCTVSLVPLPDGFRLSCNRDERRDRRAAAPPVVHNLTHRTAIFPVDPLGPGTWVGVNDAGVAAALLNRSGGSSLKYNRRDRLSRGLLIPRVLDAGSLAEAVDIYTSIDLAPFDPFQIVIVQEKRIAVGASGQTAAISRQELSRPLLFTSSSLGDSLVDAPRRRVFDRMFACGHQLWPDVQHLFHSHQWPGRPEISVLMERSDAKTVSQTVVDVRGTCVELRYREIDGAETIAVRAA